MQKNEKVIDSTYSKYVLIVLLLVYVLNFIDRQILAILAEDIKNDLGISDADLGFLFGTAFAVFYATFGIALGRLADDWNRKKLIAIGLGFWSLMTALSGIARGFLPLALCRFGVGVGEASASPAAFSMLYDYFSPKFRTTVLAIYSSGVYIGAGLGLFLGGTILDAWNSTWPASDLAPFGLKGWQATFMIVGLPGLLMAFWVSTLREPVRGQSDGIDSVSHPTPFREVGIVLLTMLPIINLWQLNQGANGRRAIGLNILSVLGIASIVYGLICLTGGVAQWMALGIGVYTAVSWAQALSVRDPIVFSMIFKCRTLLYVIVANSAVTFMGVALPFWSVPFLQRYYGVSAAEIGILLGLGTAVMGFFGVVLGGMLADKLRTYTPKGKLYVWLGSITIATLSAFFFLTVNHLALSYTGLFTLYFSISMAHGPGVSTINDLVLPRGRGTTTAFAFMIATFVGIALGPYVIGYLSDVIVARGVSDGEALRQAMLWSLLLPLIGLVLVIRALSYVVVDEESLLARASALGEKI